VRIERERREEREREKVEGGDLYGTPPVSGLSPAFPLFLFLIFCPIFFSFELFVDLHLIIGSADSAVWFTVSSVADTAVEDAF
jgi:hypothetical protein